MSRDRTSNMYGKLRSNTLVYHSKPMNLPFESALGADFLNLFAKD